jgi:hypothetical protein
MPPLRPAAFALLALISGIGQADAQRRLPRSCAAEIGASEARRLARDCRESDPETPALCRPDTTCEAMREMIREACRAPGSSAKPVCRDGDDEEGDDDDE